jgi:hypothetical protein
VITLAAAAISRLRGLGKDQEYLKLRERCYGITWNSTEASLEKGPGALDGSIDKWIEIIQYIPGLDLQDSKFLTALQGFLVGEELGIDLAPLVRAWGRACDVPPSVLSEKVSVKDAFQAINSFRNRFAHVPFPYDQVQEIYREIENCTFNIFELPPTAANNKSPLSGCFALKDSILQGAGYSKPLSDGWQAVENETFVWDKSEPETWDARPFVFLDKMMRPYLLSRLKNEAGSWEYVRYLAEANAVYGVSNSDLLKLLPRPHEADYRKDEPPTEVPIQIDAVNHGDRTITRREEASAAIRSRDFEPVIPFLKAEVEQRQNYHSGWHRLGYAQREYAVDLMDTEPEKAAELLRESIVSFTHATNHSERQYEAEAYYNRSKAHWRLWRLTQDAEEFKKATEDAKRAATYSYDNRFVSWNEFLNENLPS